jgi:dipeptidyl-peptidase-4
MMKKFIYLFILLIWALPNYTQAQEEVTTADIWQTYRFITKSVNGVNWTKDGQYYTSQNDRYIIKYNISTGNPVDTLYGKEGAPEDYVQFDGYSFSPQENKIMLSSGSEAIYRRSSKAFFYIYDITKKEITRLIEGEKQSYATFSPDGNQVAFVRDNNLYVTDLATMKTQTITTTGEKNKIIHGSTDWVYEEEFSFAQAFYWSSDSKKIGYYTFDESEVKEFMMQYWNGPTTPYPDNYQFKYPKAGEDNSKITISVYNLTDKKSIKMDIGTETDIYIPRINWTQDANLLSIRRMNRLQNQLEILHADVKTGKTQVILTEKEETYIDLDFTDDLTYLEDGKTFLHTSERNGFKHIYLYDMSGKLIRQITDGKWEVSQVYGIDEKAKMIYFTSTEDSPLQRQLYKIKFNGKGKEKLSTRKGTHAPNFSKDFKYYLDYYSAADTPPAVSLHEAKSGKQLKVLEDNQAFNERLKEYKINSKEFFTFTTSEGVELNGWMIKPLDFDKSKKYPVLMFVYGGPGSQTVTDSWDTYNYMWYQVLASKGYMVVSVDNRGTGARGAEFKKITYANLGKYEIQDQIATAKYLANLPTVDAERIGIWGWSYGGYMSSLGITVGADIFKAAIAVAPVSTWRFYDSIYTERYLKRPQDNAEGYDSNSPINHVEKLKGSYLLVHGTADDNVHFQNAIELQNALIKANKQFDSFYYPNRTHSISGGNTRFHLYTMMTNFLLKNL